MPFYTYKASDDKGKIMKGALEGADDRDVAAQLHKMGYIPIRIAPGGGSGGKLNLDIGSMLTSILSRVGSRDVMMFTQDLSALLAAGLPVDRALSILIDVSEKDEFKKIVESILRSVHGGSYLSDALAKHPKVFTRFYINMVKAGEAGGVLEGVLERLGLFLESSQDMKDFIKQALAYPLFLVFVGGVSVIILMTFVIPKFAIIFDDMGQAIPMVTRILLGLSGFLRSYWWVIMGSIALVIYLFRRWAKTPKGSLKMDRYKMDMPMIGDLVRKVETARFSRTLGTLINSGVPILQAITLVKDIITNQVISGTMDTIHERVKKGDRLSVPLRQSGLFPSLAIQMITVGEETGKLDAMLLKVAENYEKVVKNMVKRLISLLEPAMILAMGAVVGFIVISMLMAIFSINDIPF